MNLNTFTFNLPTDEEIQQAKEKEMHKTMRHYDVTQCIQVYRENVEKNSFTAQLRITLNGRLFSAEPFTFSKQESRKGIISIKTNAGYTFEFRPKGGRWFTDGKLDFFEFEGWKAERKTLKTLFKKQPLYTVSIIGKCVFF